MTEAKELVERSLLAGADHPGIVCSGRDGRTALLDLTRRILTGLRAGKMVGVAAIELDSFDALVVARGDVTGQVVLSEVTQRLADCLRSVRSGVYQERTRYLVMSELQSAPDAMQSFIEVVQGCVGQPVVVASSHVSVSASVGVTFSSSRTEDARLLLGAAEVASDLARRTTSNNLVVYDSAARAQIGPRYELGQALREGVARRDLSLRYEPIIDLQRAEPIGLSTALSWLPLNGEPVSDRALFQLAEQLGLAEQVGDLLLEEFIAQWGTVRPDGPGPSAPILIRATSTQVSSWLARSSDLLSRARAAVPGHLSIEILERDGVNGVDEELSLAWLHRLDIGVVLDDIGDRSIRTSLRVGSVDAIRLAADLVDHVHEGKDERRLASELIGLAHAFGIPTIAEGVREHAQIEALTEIGCDQVHSYFSSGSLPLGDAVGLFKDGSRGP